MTRPTAVIFDLGGVLISSPLKGIEEYEAENDIPRGYLNYAMYARNARKLTVDPLPHPMPGQILRLDDYDRTRHSTFDGQKTCRRQRHGKSSIKQKASKSLNHLLNRTLKRYLNE